MAEMASEQCYQDKSYFTTSILAVKPVPRTYRAEFTEYGFAIYADG